MLFILASTGLFILFSVILGFKKNGEKNVLILFGILLLSCLIKYGFTGSFVVSSIFNLLCLIGVINGIVDSKKDLYLAEKYDEKHEED